MRSKKELSDALRDQMENKLTIHSIAKLLYIKTSHLIEHM
jgi:hypothetical protein